MSEEYNDLLPSYQHFLAKDRKIGMSTLFNFLLGSVRSSDRTIMQRYIDEIAMKRFTAGFEVKEMTTAIETFGKVIIRYFIDQNEPDQSETGNL